MATHSCDTARLDGRYISVDPRATYPELSVEDGTIRLLVPDGGGPTGAVHCHDGEPMAHFGGSLGLDGAVVQLDEDTFEFGGVGLYDLQYRL